MSPKNVLSATLGLISLSFVAVQVHGFVIDSENVSAFEQDTSAVIKQVDELAENLDSANAVAQIEELIDGLDEALDREPKNELELMEIRDSLVELRSEAVKQSGDDDETILAQYSGGGALSSATLAAVGPAIASGGGFSAGCSSCACNSCGSGGASKSGGFSFGGGSGLGGGGLSLGSGGGGAGLLNPRRLLLVGGLVAGLASIDSDDEVPARSL